MDDVSTFPVLPITESNDQRRYERPEGATSKRPGVAKAPPADAEVNPEPEAKPKLDVTA